MPSSCALLHVGACLLEQFENVVVIDGVDREASVATHPDEPHRPKQAQLVGNSGFAQPDSGRKILDAELTVPQRIEDADAGWIAEDPECVGERMDDLNR
jgi:hypothetical protein